MNKPHQCHQPHLNPTPPSTSTTTTSQLLRSLLIPNPTTADTINTNHDSTLQNTPSVSSSTTPSQRGKLWKEALKHPIQFIKSSSQIDLNQLPYPPVNRPLTPATSQIFKQTTQPASIPSTKDSFDLIPSSSSESTNPTHQQHQPKDSSPRSSTTTPNSIVTSWLKPRPVGPGFYNTGNTCFLNATLQALVHTPALTIGLMDRDEHRPQSCRLTRDKKFCALCRMYRLVNMCFDQSCPSHAIEPAPINRALSKFAPSMRGGRQEDAHEFLRLLIEAMQNSALQGRADKVKQKQKESTFIHRMFGGKLRSRVVCDHCHTPSDTFDSFLDLSLDISHANSVSAALKAYHKFDWLRGANQYRCDKCQCLRDAKKSMSVFVAPPILTLHLKRFNFRGRKINKQVNFDDCLDLRPAMSAESSSAGYKLYAVVCHRGQSNKSGHYYAHVKASNGKWYVADDSTIESISDSRTVLANEHAYMLFYARDRESFLSAAIADNQRSSLMMSEVKECDRIVKRKPSVSDSNNHENSNTNAASQINLASFNLNDNTQKRHKTGPANTNDSFQKPFIGPAIPPQSLPNFQFNHKPSLSNLDEDLNRQGLEVEESLNQFKKKKKNRRQKAKQRRMVNLAGTPVHELSSFKPCIIRG